MGKNYTNAETVEKLASQFNLTDAERSETLSSGQAKFSKHIGWARTYLGKARLLESTGRGRFRITKRVSPFLEQIHRQLRIKSWSSTPNSVSGTSKLQAEQLRLTGRTGRSGKRPKPCSTPNPE